jgi:hypothetical protein
MELCDVAPGASNSEIFAICFFWATLAEDADLTTVIASQRVAQMRAR